MASLMKWRRPSMVNLQRDIRDIFDDYLVPRSMRRELDRLFDDFGMGRSLRREVERMMEDFDSPMAIGSRIARVFENLLGESRMIGWRGMSSAFVPSLDMVEQDDEYVMKADLPGMREEDIDIRLSDNNVLTITGERRSEDTRSSRGYEHHERSYGSFRRSIELPAGVDASNVQADFRNGVLELHLPKGQLARSRRIPLTRGEEPRVIPPSNGRGARQGPQDKPGTQEQPGQPRT